MKQICVIFATTLLRVMQGAAWKEFNFETQAAAATKMSEKCTKFCGSNVNAELTKTLNGLFARGGWTFAECSADETCHSAKPAHKQDLLLSLTGLSTLLTEEEMKNLGEVSLLLINPKTSIGWCAPATGFVTNAQCVVEVKQRIKELKEGTDFPIPNGSPTPNVQTETTDSPTASAASTLYPCSIGLFSLIGAVILFV